jgi:hypothetical protein
MTDTVLTDEEIMHLWDTRVGEPCSSFPLIGSDKRCFARAIESAVLQSPEVVAMREAATQDAINYAKSFDRGHVAGWDSALEAAIDIVAIHGGSVEIEAAIRAIKSPDADAAMKAES